MQYRYHTDVAADRIIASKVAVLLEFSGTWLFQCALEDSQQRVNAQPIWAQYARRDAGALRQPERF